MHNAQPKLRMPPPGTLARTGPVDGEPIKVHRARSRGWLHVSDPVGAIEAAGRLTGHAVGNIRHREVVQAIELAEMFRKKLGAAPGMVQQQDLPAQMTLLKRPRLKHQRRALGFRPSVPLDRGVGWACDQQKVLVASEHADSTT